MSKPNHKEIAEWVVSTCLLNGASVSTAHAVASVFVDGLAQTRSMTDAEASQVRQFIFSKANKDLPNF